MSFGLPNPQTALARPPAILRLLAIPALIIDRLLVRRSPCDLDGVTVGKRVDPGHGAGVFRALAEADDRQIGILRLRPELRIDPCVFHDDGVRIQRTHRVPLAAPLYLRPPPAKPALADVIRRLRLQRAERYAFALTVKFDVNISVADPLAPPFGGVAILFVQRLAIEIALFHFQHFAAGCLERQLGMIQRKGRARERKADGRRQNDTHA